MNKKFFSSCTLLFFWLVGAAMLLEGCKPDAQQSAGIEAPKISGDSIQFPGNSPTAQRIATAPVVAAQERTLQLPGRLVWDEDHTSRLFPPVSGRFHEATGHGALGATVKVNDALAYLISPDIATAQSEFLAAQAAYAQAQKNESRVKGLLGVNGVSNKDMEQADADWQHAKAELERTRLHLKTLGVSDKVDQRFAIRSPIDGVVVERNTNPGMEYRPDQPGAALFVISDPTYLWCWIDAPESVLGVLHNGMEVTLHSSAWPQQTFKAQVDYVGDALDASSRTVKVRARLRNPDRQLKGEMFVTAEMSGEAVGRLDVPSKAVFLNGKFQQVFVKTAGGQFTRRTIVPVASNEQWVSVSDGLSAGDQIVVDGALYLEKLLEDAQVSAPGATTSTVLAPVAATRPST